MLGVATLAMLPKLRDYLTPLEVLSTLHLAAVKVSADDGHFGTMDTMK
jgi:hypothetical protein